MEGKVFISADDAVRISDQEWCQVFKTLRWQASEWPDGVELHPCSWELVKDGYLAFVKTMEDDIDAFMEHSGRDRDDVAHDFVLTANRHGTGFWDRCCFGKGGCDLADRLTEEAHGYPMDLFEGEDGWMHLA